MSQLLQKEAHSQVSEDNSTLLSFLVALAPELSTAQIKMALSFGAVWLTRGKKTDRVRRSKRLLKKGDKVHLYFDEAKLTADITPAKLVSDQVGYSIWYKPCGMFSQGTKWGDHSAICRWIELHAMPTKQCFLVHRLDRATQGLMIIAHTKSIAKAFSKLFEHRHIEKHYLAKVNGEFPHEFVEQVIDQAIDTKNARTKVLSVNYNEKFNESQVRVSLETGRKHQIRKHFSNLGYPIIGDRLYNTETANSENRDLQLQSCLLSFNCPITHKHLTFSAADVNNDSA